jgi:hypothetical protein
MTDVYTEVIPMVKKLTRHGNSWAVVIDKPILDILNIDPAKTPFDVRTNGEGLVLVPVRGARRKKFEAALDEVNAKYGRMLKRLGE